MFANTGKNMKVWVDKTDTLEILHFYERNNIKKCSDKNLSKYI